MQVRLILRDNRIVGDFSTKDRTEISQLPKAFYRSGTYFFQTSEIIDSIIVVYQEGVIWETTATLTKRID